MRSNRKNKYIILSLIFVLCLMIVGFSAYSQRLDINETSEVTTNWNVYFSDGNVKEKSDSAKGSVTLTGKITANLATELKYPGDKVVYELTVTNGGNVSATLDSIKTHTDNNEAILFTIDGIETGTELAAGASKKFNVTVELNKNATDYSKKEGSASLELEFYQTGTSSNFPKADVPEVESLAINSAGVEPNDYSLGVNVESTGANKYYYSIDNNQWYESTSNTYTLNGLKANTNYTVYVKAEDTAGNVVYYTTSGKTSDTEKPEVLITEEIVTKGNNNWNTEAKLKITATDNDKIKTIKTCETTEETCTGATEQTLTNNSFSYNISSNSKANRVCVTATDNVGNSDTRCSEKYLVDNDNPTISNVTVTPDDDTMTIEVTGNDKASGIYKYYYSKDGGTTYIESNNSNYTFTTLDEGDYLVTVYVEDKTGNISELTAKPTTIRHAAFCYHNDITNLADCVVATEAGNKTNIEEAKAAIKAKGTPNFRTTSPTITYSERHATSTSTYQHSYYDNIGTDYSFNPTTGMYTLKNYSLKDPSSVNYNDGNNYYTCISTSTTCSQLYKITGVTASAPDATTGEVKYTMTYYAYTSGVDAYDTSEVGLYAGTDDDGDTFYYRGSAGGNYVKYARYYWRIVRVNGDGTVRLIYDGTSAHANGEASLNRQLPSSSAFNSWWSDNAYVGYMYGDPSSNTVTESSKAFTYTGSSATTKYYFGTDYTPDLSTNSFKLSGALTAMTLSEYNANHSSENLYTCFSTSATATCQRMNHVQRYVSPVSMSVKGIEHSSTSYASAHANTVNSTIKKYLEEEWYPNSPLATDNNVSKETAFCNNRKLSTEKDSTYTGEGYGIHPTFYEYTRFYNWSGTATGPDLSCEQANDKFTVSTSTGNGKLKYPVGLITADEVNMAGGKTGSKNTLYYLYTGINYWTMSPSFFSNDFGALQFFVNNIGQLYSNAVNVDWYSVRPVINLKTDNLIVEGSGTKENPYTLKN